MDLSNEQLFDIAQFSLSRLDGAWFMALTREIGVETAWKMDIEAWKQFAYVFGKKIRKDYITDPKWPASYLEAMGTLSKVFGIKGREVTVDGDIITSRVTDCDIQKAIAKAGVSDCGIVTVQTYMEVARGLFGKEMEISIKHTKNLNRGDECCEVVISSR